MDLAESSRRREERTLDADLSNSPKHNESQRMPLNNVTKSRWERTWPTIACGAGLFSDGYLNS